ncbi:MAG: DUF2933 domain-containing protein [Gammaproteobacteria bacterium]|nr:DUF2933 domain-containing protein [Gammaproteobacteria bacterium]
MEWLVENWIWVILGVAFILMHVFGHGGHKSHRDSVKDQGSRH